jgi:hypothetical protein
MNQFLLGPKVLQTHRVLEHLIRLPPKKALCLPLVLLCKRASSVSENPMTMSLRNNPQETV